MLFPHNEYSSLILKTNNKVFSLQLYNIKVLAIN